MRELGGVSPVITGGSRRMTKSCAPIYSGVQHGANYTGRALKPAPPVYAPQRLADAMVGLGLRSRGGVTVGSVTTLARLGYSIAPRARRHGGNDEDLPRGGVALSWHRRQSVPPHDGRPGDRGVAGGPRGNGQW